MGPEQGEAPCSEKEARDGPVNEFALAGPGRATTGSDQERGLLKTAGYMRGQGLFLLQQIGWGANYSGHGGQSRER